MKSPLLHQENPWKSHLRPCFAIQLNHLVKHAQEATDPLGSALWTLGCLPGVGLPREMLAPQCYLEDHPMVSYDWYLGNMGGSLVHLAEFLWVSWVYMGIWVYMGYNDMGYIYTGYTGWCFGTCFIFPNSWDDDPIWLSYFSGGWNHQPDMIYGWLVTMIIKNQQIVD